MELHRTVVLQFLFLFFLIKAKKGTYYFRDRLNRNADSLHHKSGTAETEFHTADLKHCDSCSVLPLEYFPWKRSSASIQTCTFHWLWLTASAGKSKWYSLNWPR